MTTIRIIKSNDKVETIIVEGHSEYDVAGKDIVCASISSVSYFIGIILDEIGTEFTCIEDEAFFQITLNENYDNIIIDTAFKSFIVYAEELQKQYPNNTKVIIEN